MGRGYGFTPEANVRRIVSITRISINRAPVLTLGAEVVDDEHLRKWIEFLRHCGGFEVW
jgi:hypothetical protein